MTQHDHHSHGGKHEHGTHKKRPLHHDWRLWVGVILMLLAMIAYVASFDESLAPGGTGEPVPAAPAPAAL